MRDLHWRRLVAIFLGCDFFPEIHNMSWDKLVLFLNTEFGAFDDEENETLYDDDKLSLLKAVLARVDDGFLDWKWNKAYGYGEGDLRLCTSVKPEHGGTFSALFWRAYASFAHPPVWKIHDSGGSSTPISLEQFLQGDYTVTLDPLYPIVNFAGDNQQHSWNEQSPILGYDPPAMLAPLLQKGATYEDFAKCLYSRNFNLINDEQLKPPKTATGQDAMFESEKDFDCIHPVHHSTRSLRIYLIARGIKQKSVVTKDELIDTTREVDDATLAPGRYGEGYLSSIR
jgi:hypothetical protein